MQLNWIFYNSKATLVKNAEKMTFYWSNSCFVFDSCWTLFKFLINKKKVIFPSISDMGCFRFIINSIQFLFECSILSPTDKMIKHESKTDYLHKISNDFVCIFSNISILSEIEAKWKGNLENHLYWSWPWNIKMYEHQWTFPTW